MTSTNPRTHAALEWMGHVLAGVMLIVFICPLVML